MKIKISIKKNIQLLAGILFLSVLFTSCEYETEIRSGDYPDQLIYLPAARGKFVINDISRKIGDLPFEGQPYRYVVDTEERKFIVPLAVYRAGVSNDGEFIVDIDVDTDTIARLIEGGLENMEVLSADRYILADAVTVEDGEEIAQFNLEVDLDLLLNNFPETIYALGIHISSAEREVNPDLSTAVIEIHTDMIKSTADFAYEASGEDPNTVQFINNSLMAESYSWDFGDGTDGSTNESPEHTFAASGTYNVTLAAIGITGEVDQSTVTEEVVIP